MDLGLEALLRFGWIAGIWPILVALVPAPCLWQVRVMLSRFANRGKTTMSSSKKFTVPHSYFLHFYMVAVIWTTCLLVLTWSYAYKEMVPLAFDGLHYSTVASHLTGGSHMLSMHKFHSTPLKQRYRVWRTVFVLLLMEAQVSRRLYETIYVFNYSRSARMHIFGYITGLYFYTAAPLTLASPIIPELMSYARGQIAEFIVKGRAGMAVTEFSWWEYVKPLLNMGWFQWVGAAIFIFGWKHQSRCHAILGSLREHSGADEYVVPYGDWFEMVSCPHYTAEIVIYAGLLLASGGLDVTIWFLFIFVVTNLVFAANETHRWYGHKFENYPSARRAIFPAIY